MAVSHHATVIIAGTIVSVLLFGNMWNSYGLQPAVPEQSLRRRIADTQEGGESERQVDGTDLLSDGRGEQSALDGVNAPALPLVYSVVEARGAVSFEGLRRGGGRVAGFNYAEGVRGAGDALQQPGRAVCNASEWPDLGANYTEPMRYLGNCSWELQRHEDLGQRAEKHTPQTHIATFLRTTLTDGAELDIPYAEHTETLFQRDAAAGGLLARVFGSKKIRWSQKFRGCRLCGYSCSGFKHPPTRPRERFAYPVRKRHVSVKVLTSPERLLSNAPKNLFRLYIYGADRNLEAAMTAHYMGWLTSISKGRLLRQTCRRMMDKVTFFFKRRAVVSLSRHNVAHWIHDTLFPMFMTIYNHVGDPARAKFNVVPDEGDATTSLWRQFWAVGAIGDKLLSMLIPFRSRVRLELGMCFKDAVFDCPKADSMGPIVPFQRWLQRTRSMSFVPLPLAPALNLMLLVRCKGGSRYLANWEELRAEASGMGYAVTLPPAVPVFKQMLSLVKHLQRTHVLASAHGSELAPMLFMPNGSVVVEIVPREYRYLDAWYVRQARAAGLHLLRVMPNSTDVVYHWYGDTPEKVCGRKFYRYERDVAEQPSLESGYRQLASSITVPLPTWHTVLTLAKELLFKHSLLGINATF